MLVLSLHMGLVEVGWVGVQAFFVLSGYLVTRVLLGAREQSFGGYLKQFYWNRSLRIFPVYFAYLLILAGILLLLVGAPPDAKVTREVMALDLKTNAMLFRRYLPHLATYTYNFTRLSPTWSFSPWFGHFWSLCIEEQFYLLWPFVVFLTPRRYLWLSCIALILGGPVLRLLVANYVWLDKRSLYAIGDTVYWFTGSQLDAFAWGALVAVRPPTSAAPKGRHLLAAAVFVLAVGGWVCVSLSATQSDFSLTSLGYPLAMVERGEHLWGYTLLNALFALVVAYLVGPRGSRLLERPLLVFIGRISYGMYVFHWLVLIGVQFTIRAIARTFVVPDEYSLGGVAIYLMYFLRHPIELLLTIGLAWVSYRYFETRFLKLKSSAKPAPP